MFPERGTKRHYSESLWVQVTKPHYSRGDTDFASALSLEDWTDVTRSYFWFLFCDDITSGGNVTDDLAGLDDDFSRAHWTCAQN